MTIYIAGPMSGIEDFNRPAFEAAEIHLRELGHVPLNPGILPTDLPEGAYLPISLAMLQQADAIYLLKGWIISDGAQIEARLARRQGLAEYHEGTKEPPAACTGDACPINWGGAR